jgi:hypothetical protein
MLARKSKSYKHCSELIYKAKNTDNYDPHLRSSKYFYSTGHWLNLGYLWYYPTYVDELAAVPVLQVPQDGGVVEVGEARHVFAFFKLWRIHLCSVH